MYCTVYCLGCWSRLCTVYCLVCWTRLFSALFIVQVAGVDELNMSRLRLRLRFENLTHNVLRICITKVLNLFDLENISLYHVTLRTNMKELKLVMMIRYDDEPFTPEGSLKKKEGTDFATRWRKKIKRTIFIFNYLNNTMILGLKRRLKLFIFWRNMNWIHKG